MKKIILSFILFSVFAYVLACAWAMDWLDNQKVNYHFFKQPQNTKQLDIVKSIWKITPTFDSKKDKDRALKISELYISSLSVYSDKEEMIKNCITMMGISYCVVFLPTETKHNKHIQL